MKIAIVSLLKNHLPYGLPFFPSISWQNKLLVSIFISVLVFFRAPHEFINPQLWAEDGTVFLSQAHTLGLQSIVTPYAGYLHVLPRTVAFFANFFPLESAPHIYFIFSFLALHFVCQYLARVPWLPVPLKIAFPLAVVLAPHTGEVFLTLTNIHWICALLLPFIAFDAHRQDATHIAKTSALLLLIGLSDPFIIVFYPLFVARFIFTSKGDHLAFFVWLTATCTLCIQLPIFFLGQSHERLPVDTDISHWIEAVLVRPLAGLFLGREVGWIGYTVPSASYILGTGLSLFSALLGYAILTAGPQTRRISVAFGILAGLSFFAAFARLPDRPLLLAPFAAGDRYYFLPFVFSCFALIWLAHTATGWRKKLGVCACCIVLFSTASVFQYPRKPDLHWREHVAELKHHKVVSVPLNPTGWTVILHR